MKQPLLATSNKLFPISFLFSRKKFGWITFIVNLSLYLAFLLPFTALAVYLKINILELCDYQFENMTKHRTGYYEHKPWVSNTRPPKNWFQFILLISTS